jgi:hypothetical protein
MSLQESVYDFIVDALLALATLIACRRRAHPQVGLKVLRHFIRKG